MLVGTPAKSGVALPWVAGLVLGGLIVGGLSVFVREEADPPPVTRFTVGHEDLAPYRVISAPLAVSPDGTHIVYRATTESGVSLVVRSLDGLEVSPIGGSQDARGVFFAPDSRRFGFFDQGNLYVTALGGGAPVRIHTAEFPISGASWGDDRIVFTSGGELYSVLPDGSDAAPMSGAPESTRLRGDPQVLPGGGVLYTTRLVGSRGDVAIYARASGSEEERLVLSGADSPRYLASGHLLFGREGQLMVTAFDVDSLAVVGESVAAGIEVMVALDRMSHLAVSANGTLVYRPGEIGRVDRRPVWRDRDGSTVPIPTASTTGRYPRLSPSGDRLAITLGPAGEGDIWILDLEQGSQPIQVTFEGHDIFPVWRNDDRITFASFRGATGLDLYEVAADGSELEATIVLIREALQRPLQWLSNGTRLLYEDASAGSMDLMLLNAEADQTEPWLASEFSERAGRASSDGRWVIYESDRTGTTNIWLRQFPDGAPFRVSSDGGVDPVWSQDGNEIFYQFGDALWGVRLDVTSDRPRLSLPLEIFDGDFYAANASATPHTYDIAPDGRFLLLETLSDSSAGEYLVVVQNWFEELHRLVPTN